LISLLVNQVLDGFVRANFQRLQDYLNASSLLRGNYSFRELTLGAVTNHNVAHSLGFVPVDIIQTYVSDGADVIWHYDNFTSTTLQVSTTKACTVRAYIGRHKEGN
jgi:hypothetical protein